MVFSNLSFNKKLEFLKLSLSGKLLFLATVSYCFVVTDFTAFLYFFLFASHAVRLFASFVSN